MPILAHAGITPQIAPDVFVAEGAVIIGDVRIASGSSVWYNAVLRGDLASITIGHRTNIQDNVTIHVDKDQPAIIGSEVSIGHGAIVHAAIIEDLVLIGMNSVVLSGCRVGRGSIVGAGGLVSGNDRIPPLSMVIGLPGKVRRQLTEAEGPGEAMARAERYYRLAETYRLSRPST